jgi:hypothetical protein
MNIQSLAKKYSGAQSLAVDLILQQRNWNHTATLAIFTLMTCWNDWTEKESH